MTLAELIAAVYVETKRPDLVDRTKQAVKSATLKLHQLEYFQKDVFETGIIFDTSDYYQSFEYKTTIPRWRSAQYFRKYDYSMPPGRATDDFDIVTIGAVRDEYGAERNDITYLAGNVYQFKSATQFQYMLMGCYLNPDLDDVTFTSFIAEEYPFAIVYEAARIICKGIGKDAESSYYDAMFREQWIALTTAEIQSKGY